MPVRVNNDNNNLTDVRNEFEALKNFLIEELHHLRQQVQKNLLNLEIKFWKK